MSPLFILGSLTFGWRPVIMKCGDAPVALLMVAFIKDTTDSNVGPLQSMNNAFLGCSATVLYFRKSGLIMSSVDSVLALLARKNIYMPHRRSDEIIRGIYLCQRKKL